MVVVAGAEPDGDGGLTYNLKINSIPTVPTSLVVVVIFAVCSVVMIASSVIIKTISRKCRR